MEQYSFYLIGKNFKDVLRKDMLSVFYELISRENTTDFGKRQIDKLTDYLDTDGIKKHLITKFQDAEGFSISNEGSFILEGSISGAREEMIIKDKKITLFYESGISRFFDFLALFHPELVAINENKGEIIELTLVKPLHIG